MVKTSLQEVNAVFSRLEENNDKLVDLASNESDIDTFNNYITECEGTKISVNNLYYNYKQTSEKAQAQRDNVKFNVKKISAPEFKGDIRSYAIFKDDYIRLIESKYGDDNFALRSCLSDDVIKQFIWSTDYQENWKRLDSKYGSSPKVIDYVINSIKTLKPISEGNNSKLIESINVIERGWFYLKRLNKEGEIEKKSLGNKKVHNNDDRKRNI